MKKSIKDDHRKGSNDQSRKLHAVIPSHASGKGIDPHRKRSDGGFAGEHKHKRKLIPIGEKTKDQHRRDDRTGHWQNHMPEYAKIAGAVNDCGFLDFVG